MVLVGAAALAQLRITSFNAGGELRWTNSFPRGLYCIEGASSPSGLWTSLATVVDLDPAKTNEITFQLPVTNVQAQAAYRVAWITPNPIGVWDYQGYDKQGGLVITGQLNITSTPVLSTNPPGYGIQGSWNLQYAGPPTNQLWWLGPQIGTGAISGSLDVGYASLTLWWPENTSDDNIQLYRDLWANTYTGRWIYVTWSGPLGGNFSAQKKH